MDYVQQEVNPNDSRILHHPNGAAFWMTLNPADVNSPIAMKLAGVDIDVSSHVKDDMPAYCERLRLIAGDPVACADFYHDAVDAVLTTLLRFGAPDGDGEVLGRIKAYEGMTEEQRWLTLHCHLLVWVYGFNDFTSFRELMDKTPERYAELACFFSRIVSNQIASKDDLSHALQGADEPAVSSELPSVPDATVSSGTESITPVKQCLATPPPAQCWRRPGVERSLPHDNDFVPHMQPDSAEVTTSANVHKCSFTCHKGGPEDSCRCDAFCVGPVVLNLYIINLQFRLDYFIHIKVALTSRFPVTPMSRFGFSNGGKALVPHTIVQRGFMTIHTNGDMVVEGIVYSKDRSNEALQAAAAAAAQEGDARREFEQDAIAFTRAAPAQADQFIAVLRRLSGNVNSYNLLIQYCIRSNMDLTVMLRDSVD